MNYLMFRRGVVSVYIILALITGGFVTLFVVENEIFEMSVEAAVIYVDDDGQANYTSIQAAIDNASSGDTIYVWEGWYNEDIIINKSLTLIGNSTINTTINGTGTTDIVYITADWVNITNLSVINKYNSIYAGVKVDGGNNCKICNINCSKNGYGIYLLNADYSILKNNNCFDNSWSGIQIGYWPPSMSSNYSVVENNNCSNNRFYGIRLYSANLNVIKNNTR